MEQVKGIGGIFFKSDDKARLLAWYHEHLGIDVKDWGGTVFQWRAGAPSGNPGTTWSIFAGDTSYFGNTGSPYMINYRVDNLDRMLEQLRAAGVDVDDKIEDSEFGRFGWAHDIDGNRFELWQPAEGM